MIIVSSPSKPFTYTAKNTARRQAILQDYEAEIEALYNVVEESAQAELAPPSSWDIAAATDFVRLVVNKVMNNAVADDDNLFYKGCDRSGVSWKVSLESALTKRFSPVCKPRGYGILSYTPCDVPTKSLFEK